MVTDIFIEVVLSIVTTSFAGRGPKLRPKICEIYT